MPGFGYGDTLRGNRLLGLQGNARGRGRLRFLSPSLSLESDQISKQAKRNNLATFALEEQIHTQHAPVWQESAHLMRRKAESLEGRGMIRKMQGRQHLSLCHKRLTLCCRRKQMHGENMHGCGFSSHIASRVHRLERPEARGQPFVCPKANGVVGKQYKNVL